MAVCTHAGGQASGTMGETLTNVLGGTERTTRASLLGYLTLEKKKRKNKLTVRRDAGDLVQKPHLTCKKNKAQKDNRYPYMSHLQTPMFLGFCLEIYKSTHLRCKA